MPDRFDYRDRSNWGPGPWDREPDRFEWEHAGLPCMLIRGPVGSWCGYAAVVPGHPMFGKDYSACLVHKDVPVKRELQRARRRRELAHSRQERDTCQLLVRTMEMIARHQERVSPCRHSYSAAHPSPERLLSVHGGITYANACHGTICHTPIRPGQDHVWWFGFDTGHAFDLAPGLRAAGIGLGLPSLFRDDGGTYRTFDYVKGETDRLAEQLRWLGRYTPKDLRGINRAARAERGY